MKHSLRQFLLGCLLSSWVLPCSAADKEQDQIRIVVPMFEGGALGSNVATVLNLKIWRTLRRRPIGGKVMWTTEPLSASSHGEAERCARNNNAQMILWGYAAPFVDKVLVQAFLSIPEYEDLRNEYPENWTVTLPNEDAPIDLSVSLPRRRYEFSSIVLDKQLVDRYTLPSALKLYSTKGGNTAVGDVGGSFTAGKHEGDYTFVVPDGGKAGWIHLPKLDSEVEIINFAGGLMRLFRADYSGAIELLHKVSDTAASTSLKIDALLLEVLAKAKQKQDPISLIDAAIALNPHLQISIKFKVAALVSKYMAHPGSKQSREIAGLLENVISENEYLFSPDDKWLAAARRASDYISKKSAQ